MLDQAKNVIKGEMEKEADLSPEVSKEIAFVRRNLSVKTVAEFLDSDSGSFAQSLLEIVLTKQASFLTKKASPEFVKEQINLLLNSNVDGYARRTAAMILGMIVEGRGTIPDKVPEALIFFLADQSADLPSRTEAAIALKQVIKASKDLSEELIAKIFEATLKYAQENPPLFYQIRVEKAVVELLKEAITKREPTVKEIVLKFLNLMREKFQILEYTENFLITFLESFLINPEEVETLTSIEQICRKTGIAFYKTQVQYHIAGQRRIYPREIT